MSNGCVKCGSRDAGQKNVAMTGSGASRLFNVQHNQFTVVYCKDCGYSEFYKRDSSKAKNVLDFLKLKTLTRKTNPRESFFI